MSPEPKDVKHTYESFLRSLNAPFEPTEEQRNVITSSEPLMLVVAGAGSGKTATMANRIAYQVAAGNVRPDQVLGLTFTRKAAGELSERVNRVLSQIRLSASGDARQNLAWPKISTYNSFAAEIASSYGLVIGANPRARLITDAERWQLMESIIDSLSASQSTDLFSTVSRRTLVETSLKLAAGIIDNRPAGSHESSGTIGQFADQVEVFLTQEIDALARLAADDSKIVGQPQASKYWTELKKNAPNSLSIVRALLTVVRTYFDKKNELGLVEFADQVSTASQVLERFPELGTDISEQYRLILLDEYQDTSKNQEGLLLNALGGGLKSDSGFFSLCAVGDPNQAIYGWRGASASALEDFAANFGKLRMVDPAIRSLAQHEDPADSSQPLVERLTLSTSFRNDAAILAAANALAHSQLPGRSPVARLQARPQAGTGRVVEIRPFLREDSYRAIAWRIRDVFEQVRMEPGNRQAEVAVLCRKRAYIALMIDALIELDIPYEVVGGESLISRPEILSIRAALGVVVNPARNDLLLRLATLMGVGATDMRVLAEWSNVYAKSQVTHAEMSARDERSLVEAVSALPPTTWSSRDGMSFSRLGYERLQHLASILEQVRQSIHLPLPDVIASASRLLGIDVAVAFRSVGKRRVRTSIDSFIALGGSYQANHPGSTAKAFIEWVDAVAEKEFGGEESAGSDYEDDTSVEVNAGTVQIMTVHSAKGLEWRDLVAIPEMVTGQFAEIHKGARAWPQNKEIFPFPLRQDYEHLPQFRISDMGGKEEAGAAYAFFRQSSLLIHESAEARRLAYVAVTRPQREVLLAGYALKEPEAKPRSKKETTVAAICERSEFLTAIREEAHVVPIKDLANSTWPANLVEEAPEEASIAELREWIDLPESWEVGKEPVPDHLNSNLKSWPRDISHSFHRGIGTRPGSEASQGGEPNQELAEVPLDLVGRAHAIAAQARENDADRELENPYYTATDMVHLLETPHEFILNQRRPIPRQPTRAARLGTLVHSRIANYFGQPLTLDLDSINENETDPDVPSLRPTSGASSVEEDRLYHAFEQSRWANFAPLGIEESLEIVVGGKIVRCTIDAVLDTSTAPSNSPVTIVDWKTGRRPTGQLLESRELQLALYRLAWARHAGIPVSDIGACFVYLAEPPATQDLHAGFLSEEAIVARIEHALAQGKSLSE